MSASQMKTHAGFWQRVGAFVLDYVIILFYLVAVSLIFLLLNLLFNLNDRLFTDRVRAQLTAFLLITLPVALYFAISESSKRQATWGKQRMKLRVTDGNGERINFWKALARTFLKFIPWELSFSPQADSILIYYGFGFVYLLVGLNIANLLLTKTHQTIYDLLTKTYVVQQAL